MQESASLLIVDDERGPTESLRMIFKPSYEVFTASHADEALTILRDTPIDVVTLDLRMPGMPGTELLEHIKSRDPDIEVIIVTGYAALESAIKSIRHRVFDYVTKPFEVAHIADLVRRAVGRRRAALRLRSIKEDFLANLSHELRTPLSAIIGYGSILGEELHALVNDDQRIALERIQCNAEELLKLIESVLLLNSMDAGDMPLTIRPFLVSETLERLVRRFQPVAATKGLTLRMEVTSPYLCAVTDEEKVERILTVLLDNAVKFTPRGSVTLTARPAPQPEALEIVIADTGIGMRSDEVTEAMKGLVQADSSSRRRYRGLGLGLRIATRLLELLGGDLRIHSEPAAGTCCIATIPAHTVASGDQFSGLH